MARLLGLIFYAFNWASIQFAQAVLPDLLFPASSPALSSLPVPAVFWASHLRDATVLELGAGTGVLAALLGPFAGRYVATDLPELIHLIRRNIGRAEMTTVGDHSVRAHKPHHGKEKGHHHTPSPKGRHKAAESPRSSPKPTITTSTSTVIAAPLDWDDVASTTPRSTARRRTIAHLDPFLHRTTDDSPQTHIDILLAVDTLYNTALIPSFLAVLDELASPPSPPQASSDRGNATLVVVACELRDEDVLRTFLQEWLDLGSSSEYGWVIWRVGGGGVSDEADDGDTSAAQEDDVPSAMHFMDGPFVTWVGWKVLKTSL